MTNHSDQTNSQHEPGDMLTKMEVCHLFCERLNISKATYYKKIYPWLKFTPVGEGMPGRFARAKGTERMPYKVAIGLLNWMTKNRQPDDLSEYDLQKYVKSY
jgi:hypothetical protein